MEFTLLSFDSLTGKVYRSCMPFSRTYDRAQQIYPAYRQAGIQTVVMLASDEECLRKSGHNLRQMYQQDGLEVIYLPVEDYGVPDLGEFTAAVEQAFEAAQAGRNVAIHCHAGIGRTGTFAACLARRALGISGNEAVQWVRSQIFGAVETDGQKALVDHFSG